MSRIVLSAAGISTCLTFVVLPGINWTLVPKGPRRGESGEGAWKRETTRSDVMNIMEGQGVGGHVGDESSPFFFFSTVSNGFEICDFRVLSRSE